MEAMLSSLFNDIAAEAVKTGVKPLPATALILRARMNRIDKISRLLQEEKDRLSTIETPLCVKPSASPKAAEQAKEILDDSILRKVDDILAIEKNGCEKFLSVAEEILSAEEEEDLDPTEEFIAELCKFISENAPDGMRFEILAMDEAEE